MVQIVVGVDKESWEGLLTTLMKAALIFIEDKSYIVCARDRPYRVLL